MDHVPRLCTTEKSFQWAVCGATCGRLLTVWFLPIRACALGEWGGGPSAPCPPCPELLTCEHGDPAAFHAFLLFDKS